MRVRISKSGLFFLIYTFIAFLPGYFKPGIFQYAEIALACMAIYVALRNGYRGSGFFRFVLIYHLYIIVVSLVRGSESFQGSTALDFMRIIVYIMMLDFLVKKKREEMFTVICGILLLYTLIDFVSLIACPDGLLTVDLVWNEWYTTQNAIWFIGGKNARWYYYMTVLVILAWKAHVRPNFKKKALVILYAGIAICAMLLEQSDTSATVLGVAAVGSLFYVFYNTGKKAGKPFKILPVLLVYAVITALIVTDHAFFLKPIVEGVFGKTLTFSSRIQVWAMTFLQIAQKPLFGSGYMDAAAARKLFGSLTYNHAHDQWLQFLWNGGICLFLICGAFFIKMANRIYHLQSRKDEIFVFCVFLGILINMIFEVNFSNLSVWILLYIIYNFNRILQTETGLRQRAGRLRRVYRI